MPKTKKLKLTMTQIEPTALKVPTVAPAHRAELAKLVDGEPELASSPLRQRFKVAQALADERAGRAVTSSLHLSATGRVITRSPLGGPSGALELLWFDPDGPVQKLELSGVRNGDDWLPSPDGKRVAMMGTAPYGVLEVDLDTGTWAVRWKLDPAKMAWFVYDYVSPDRMLLVVGMRRGPDRALLLERRGDALVEIAALDDVTCDEFRVVGHFAFLKGDSPKKRDVLFLDGDAIRYVGTQLFPADPWDLAAVGDDVVWSSQGALYRIDGLAAAAGANRDAAPEAGAEPDQSSSAKLSGFELQRALLHALDIPAGAGFRSSLLAALRMAEPAIDFFIDDVPELGDAQSQAEPAHTLVVWMSEGGIMLYVVAHEGLPAELDAALDRAGGSFQEHIDVGDPRRWAANLRLMAALGEPGDLETLQEIFLEPAENEWEDWPEYGPSLDELERHWGAWATLRVRGPADLGRNLTRVCALQMLS